VKALVSTRPGGPETLVLGELPEPVPAAGQLLVEVAACGVNYPDVLVIEDLYQYKPARPFAPGSEIAGTVIGVGANVADWQLGDRLVATLPGSGGMAEKACVSALSSHRLPGDGDLLSASALLLTYATALHALKDRAALRSGETVLVLGAAGGVGIAAVEVAKAMGARVIAAVSDDTKRRAVLSVGADEAIVYPVEVTSTEQVRALAADFKAAAGSHGIDVIVDPVGGDYAEAALRAIAWQGRYLVIGFPAGIPRMPLNLVLIKACSVIGVFQGAFGDRQPEDNADNVRTLLAWWGEGLIQPKIADVYPLEQGAAAIQHIRDRKAIGKVVVAIGDLARSRLESR